MPIDNIFLCPPLTNPDSCDDHTFNNLKLKELFDVLNAMFLQPIITNQFCECFLPNGTDDTITPDVSWGGSAISVNPCDYLIFIDGVFADSADPALTWSISDGDIVFSEDFSGGERVCVTYFQKTTLETLLQNTEASVEC